MEDAPAPAREYVAGASRCAGRGGYRRYDESTATRLDEAGALLIDRWNGDLRRLREEAEADIARISKLLQEFPGIGPTGAGIFLREAQKVWPEARPYTDKLTIRGARASGLPESPEGLADLVAGNDFANLAAALVKVARDPALLEE
ncbi:hypothetical protein [Brevibacterium sp. UCMA 11754]|uniref:hypothetical protein n=1 Tax=Brevibacterium sp. UCMA 11754 TaxID=2749198 RepID=UPI001F297E9B|nr:hypothetical protein [Brevibacterium sp. UCMA 11754]